MKNKRSLILASGILFIISAVSFVGTSFLVAFSIDPTISYLSNEFYELAAVGEMNPEYIGQLLNFIKIMLWCLVGVCIIFAVIDVVFGVLLIKHSKKSDEIVSKNKALIITSLVFAFICGGLISAILLIVALCIKEDAIVAKDEKLEDLSKNTSDDLKNQTSETTLNDSANAQNNIVNEKYAVKIIRLKKLRDSGAITKEEYDKLLKQVFLD